METLKECVDLLLNALIQMVVGLSLAIKLFVGIGYIDVSSIGDQVDFLCSSEEV